MSLKPETGRLHAENSSCAMTTSVLAAEPMSQNRLAPGTHGRSPGSRIRRRDGGGPKPVAPDRVPAGLSRLPGNPS